MGNQEMPPRDALQRAWDVQAAASRLGFDWTEVSGVLGKVHEETEEIRSALEQGALEHARRELGDLLFSAVNLARFLDVAPQEVLEQTTTRFERRFALVCEEVRRRGRNVSDYSLAELDLIWDAVKLEEQGP